MTNKTPDKQTQNSQWEEILNEGINGETGKDFDLSDWQWDIRFNVVQKHIIELLEPKITELEQQLKQKSDNGQKYHEQTVDIWEENKKLRRENKELLEKNSGLNWQVKNWEMANKELRKSFGILLEIVKSIKSHLDNCIHGDIKTKRMSAIYLMTEKALNHESVIAVQNRDKGE